MSEHGGGAGDAEVDYGEEEPLEHGYEHEHEHGLDEQDATEQQEDLAHGGAAQAAAALAAPTPQAEQQREAQGSRPPPPAVAAAATSRGEEWERMDVPEGWRPLPLLRAWGVHAEATADDLLDVLHKAGVDNVRSVAFDSKAQTARGQVAFVRLHPPPLPWLVSGEGQDAPEADVTKVAEGVVARLRAAQPPLQLLGQDLHFERTLAEVSLFLANVKMPESELRTRCEQYGTLERCFVLCNPAGQSKEYAFVEFSVPSQASACREAWSRAAEEQKPGRDSGAQRYVKIKLARAETGMVRRVQDLFASSLFVDNLHTTFTDLERLRRIFSAHGEVIHVSMPRNVSNPQLGRGFAFVYYKHSYSADAAWRALDGTEHNGIGRLVISMSNPAKASDPQRLAGIQQQANGGRGMQQQGVGGGRGSAPGRGGIGRGGRGMQQGDASSGMLMGMGRGLGSMAIVPPPVPPAMVLPGGSPAILPAATPLAMQAAAGAAAMQQAAMMQQMAMQRQMAMQQQVMMMAARNKEQELALHQMMAAQKELEAQRKAEAEAAEKARREAEYARRMAFGFALASSAAGSTGGMGSMGMGMPGMGVGLAGFPAAALPGMGGVAMGAAGLMGSAGAGMYGLGMQQQAAAGTGNGFAYGGDAGASADGEDGEGGGTGRDSRRGGGYRDQSDRDGGRSYGRSYGRSSRDYEAGSRGGGAGYGSKRGGSSSSYQDDESYGGGSSYGYYKRQKY